MAALAFREIARVCDEPWDVAALALTCREASDACAERLRELKVPEERTDHYELRSNGVCFGVCSLSPPGFRLTGIVRVVTAASGAWAALTRKGTVITWGSRLAGGDSSLVEHLLVHVEQIASTVNAFAARTSQGTVITWGHEGSGGDSSAVQPLLSGVVHLASTNFAFAARTSQGTVITWGHEGSGGDSSAVQPLLSGVVHLASTLGAFAALTRDGRVVSWGSRYSGGYSEHVQQALVLGGGAVSLARNFPCSFCAATARMGGVFWGGSWND